MGTCLSAQMANPVASALFAVTSVISLWALMSCSNGNPTSSFPDKGIATDTFTYIRTGDSLMITGKAKGFCWGNDLISKPDGIYRGAVLYILDHDTLMLKTGRTSMGSADGVDTVIWETYTVHIRQGFGTGLKGLWRITGERAELVKGNPTPDQQQRLDMYLGYDAEEMAAFPGFVEFEDARLIYHTDADLAGKFLYDWNHAHPGVSIDSSSYAIEIRAIGKSAVELKGKKTDETVQITLSADNSRRYTSDSPSHLPYTYEGVPTACPNHFAPQWYDQFLWDNVRGPIR